MRKIILGVAVSLDGLIEGPNGEYDWCFTDQDYGMSEFLTGVDAIFYGRKSYEMMMNFDGGNNPFANKKSYVFSTQGLQNAGSAIVLKDMDEARKLREGPGKDIWLFGGASLTTSMMNAALVDELWLAVHPIVLGKGKALFSGVEKRIPLRFLDSKAYETGLVSVRYAVG